MFKNVASQKLVVFAYTPADGLPKTGDAANITAYVGKDGGALTVLADTSAAEMDSTNGKGFYQFDLAQGETNADILQFSAKSSTSGVVVIAAPAVVFTRPPLFTTLAIDASGNAGADVKKWLGTTVATPGTAGIPSVDPIKWATQTIPTPNVTGVPKVDPTHLLGTAWLAPGTAGTPDVNAKLLGGTAYATAAAALVQAVWDALTSALTTAGSIGNKLADWVVGTIDTYSGNTKQTGDAFARLGAPAGVSTAADIAAVKAVDDAVKAKTDNLPSDPADASDISTAFAAVPAAVWASGTRILTAGTNIALAKGTGVTGFTDLSAADVRTALGMGSANLDTQLAAIVAAARNKLAKNTAVSGFTFPMTDSTNHAPTTGLTVTAQRSIDGAAFGSCTNSVTELASGVYKINLSAADLNGDVILLRFTATGADDRLILVLTQPT